MRGLFIGVVLFLSAWQSGCQVGSGACLYGGRSYPAGGSFPSDDGCNTCSCLPQGDVACTLRACIATGDGGDTVMCTATPAVFPTFDKRCTLPADCVTVLHQTNCCGSAKAIGIVTSEKGRFDRDEQICDAMYPKCGCPTLPPVAEDGKSSTGGNDIAVACKAGSCMTFIP